MPRLDLYRGHPFIILPEPVMELCGLHTLFAEEIRGAPFDDMCARNRAERDRAGEIVFRFAYGTVHRAGFFNADTHPGNYAFLPGGRVAFYDFGATKVMVPSDWATFVRLAARLIDGDTQSLFDDCVATGFVRRPRQGRPAPPSGVAAAHGGRPGVSRRAGHPDAGARGRDGRVDDPTRATTGIR